MEDRERAMFGLAKQLQFQVTKHGSSYSLRRVTDVSEPAEIENVTLEKAEEFLNTWKLRGFHGG
jgi:hypothetical protein